MYNQQKSQLQEMKLDPYDTDWQVTLVSESTRPIFTKFSGLIALKGLYFANIYEY